MSWIEKMSEWGGANLAFISEDGEVLTFAIVGEPHLIEGKYKGNATQRIAAPIVTTEGFTLLIMGKRLARRMAKHEKDFSKVAFEVVRHGTEGDTDTRYELNVLDDKETTKTLLKLAKEGNFTDDIDEALTEARQIANQ